MQKISRQTHIPAPSPPVFDVSELSDLYHVTLLMEQPVIYFKGEQNPQK